MSLHGAKVLSTVESGIAAMSPVAASWRRSAERHGLDPDSLRPPESDPVALRAGLEREAKLVAAAGPYLDVLFAALGDPDGGTCLADRNGLMLAVRYGRSHDVWKRRPHLWLGTEVSERAIGSNGTGTCLVEERPVAIRAGEHFLTILTHTSCYAAPIFAPDGSLIGALNALTVLPCRADPPGGTLTQMAVTGLARRIETELFAAAFPRARLVLASTDGRHPGALLAVERGDAVVGATRRARQLLQISDQQIGAGLDLGTLNGQPEPDTLADAELRLIERVLGRLGGNVSAAASEIGISRSTLYRKLSRARSKAGQAILPP